jgi:mono/diheme cytochrome c family protein
MNVFEMKTISSIVFVGIAVALAGCGRKDAARSRSEPAGSQPANAAVAHTAVTFSDFPVAPKPAVTPELLARGKQLYAQNCEACHGEKETARGTPRRFSHRNHAIS